MNTTFKPRPRYNRYEPRPQRKYYQLNLNIQAVELRVIDDQGKQIGVLSKHEALRLAQEKNVDLVLIVPQAKPPIAKIIDYKKFLYQEEKKEKKARKGIKKSVVKDLKLSLFIAEGDLERLVAKGQEFLKDGNQLRINLTLRGREMGKKDMAFDLMKRYILAMGEVNVSKEPRIEGRVIRAVMARKK